MQGGSTSNGDIILSGSSPKEDLISGFNTKGDLRHKWIYLEGISINMNSKDIFYNFFSSKNSDSNDFRVHKFIIVTF